MNKFWKWMEEKGYGYMSSNNLQFIYDKHYTGKMDQMIEPTKQTLVGHKIKYLAENGKDAFIDLHIITLNCINNLNRQLDKMIEKLNA